MSRFSSRRLLVVLCALAVTVPLQLATGRPAGAADPSPPSRARGDAGEARTALDRVEAIVHGTGHGDLTMALRDLAVLRGRLTGRPAERAAALLARPTAGGGDGTLDYHGLPEAAPVCSSDICVHYVTSGSDASTAQQAAATLAVFQHVHDVYETAGYRVPLPDGAAGGDARIDVYLGDLGEQGLYGYCTSDQPDSDPLWSRWAYCAVDNDFSAGQFPTNTPAENLEVTAAHEYFHATQFAYDFYEDSWLMEATATWAEDELYDAVDDNLQYLGASQLGHPGIPLDTFNDPGTQYGTWSFFRYLTERFPAAQGGLPTLVRTIWERLAGVGEDPGQYSWQAVNTVLKAKHTTGATMLADYAVANRHPAAYYSEGRANHYPTAPLAGSARLDARHYLRPTLKVDHLASATVAIKPKGLTPKSWKLRVAFDLGTSAQESKAVVTVVSKTGRLTVKRVALNAKGVGKTSVPFSTKKVGSVEVTVVNGSGRFSCWHQTSSSCQGVSLDDDLRMSFTATPYR